MTPVLLKICFCDSIVLFANNPANTASVARRSEPCWRFDAALLPAKYQRAYIQCQFRALMNAAVSQADTLCYHLLLPMMQGGPRGPPRAGKLWAADCRLRCWLVTNLCGFRTAVCTPQIDPIFLRYHSQKREKYCVA